MKKHRLILLALLGLMVLVSACAPKPPTISADTINTSIAQTVAVQFTKTAEARPSDTPMPTATMMPTRPPVTPAPPTAQIGAATTPMGTIAVITPAAGQPANTQAAGTAPAPVAPVGGTERGDWVSSDPADKSTLTRPAHKVTIKIMNTGDTTWTTDYGIEYVSGQQFGLPNKINSPIAVPPRMMVDFVLELQVPAAGPFRSDWKIVNAQGVQIGIFYMEYN